MERSWTSVDSSRRENIEKTRRAPSSSPRWMWISTPDWSRLSTDSAGVDLLLRELGVRCLRLVPAAEHVQRVGPLGQHSPFLRTVPELSCQGEGFVEVSERVGVLVTAKALVGEVEVAVARLVPEVVVERYLQGVPEERPGTPRGVRGSGDARLRAQRDA